MNMEVNNFTRNYTRLSGEYLKSLFLFSSKSRVSYVISSRSQKLKNPPYRTMDVYPVIFHLSASASFCSSSSLDSARGLRSTTPIRCLLWSLGSSPLTNKTSPSIEWLRHCEFLQPLCKWMNGHHNILSNHSCKPLKMTIQIKGVFNLKAYVFKYSNAVPACITWLSHLR